MGDTNMDKVIGKIQKLMAKTMERGCTEAEAESAAAKVSELMADYNLDTAQVEAAGGNTNDAGGERTKEQNAKKAMYKWQQDLMKNVAEVSYCYHFLNTKWSSDKSGKSRKSTVHVLVGRKVNVMAAQMMFDYLCEAIERLVPITSNKERLSRSAMSWKEGCAARLCERLATRRYEAEREQERQTREAAARSNSSTAMTLASVAKNERDANWEHAHGYAPGTLAKWRAENASRSLEAVAQDREMTSAETKEWEKTRARWRRQEESDRRKRERAWAKKDHVAYNAGWEKGADIGLDTQVDADEAVQGAPRIG